MQIVSARGEQARGAAGEWFHGARPTTLVLSCASVLVGTASSLDVLAAGNDNGFRLDWNFWIVAVLCVLVGVCFQIAVNYANDYSDGIRGTDAKRAAKGDDRTATSVTSTNSTGLASSGPYRLVASGFRPKSVLRAAMVAAGCGCVFGLAIVAVTGYYWLVAVGAVCLLGAWFYTGGKHPYGYAGLGEVGVFIFFGLVAVLGTQYCLAGRIDLLGVLGAVSAGLLSITTMMVNNIRDIGEDLKNNKRTLEVRIGRWRSEMLLRVIFVCEIVCVSVSIAIAMLRADWLILVSATVCVGLVLIVAPFVGFVIVGVKVLKGVRFGFFVESLQRCSVDACCAAVTFLFSCVLSCL